MMHCNVIILLIVCGACFTSEVQSMKCSIDGKLQRAGRFFQKKQLQQNNVPNIQPSERLKRLNDECQMLMVKQNPPPKGFNIDQPATRDTKTGHTSEVVRVDFGESIKKPYAVKRISMPWIAATTDTDAYKDTCTEMKILQDVKHPFIVKLLWSLYNEKYAVMIFDYYEMGTFLQLLQSASPLSEAKAKFYTAQLVLAVEYLHEKNIVHRDIKGENILVDNEGNLKLTDFGASVVDDGKLTDDRVGTILYMAPEIFATHRSTDKYLRKPTDVWSLGIIIYSMLFAKVPYKCYDPASMLNLIKQSEVRLPEYWYVKIEETRPHKPELTLHQSTERLSMSEMLLGMLNRDPKDRLTIKQVKNHESWNTPSAWIMPGSNPPKFDWDALQQRNFPAPIQSRKDFQKYIDTETGYEFDIDEVSE